MAKMTITVALGEIKIINKRITKKRELVLQHTTREAHYRDPFEKEEGSIAKLSRERQSISDLENRIVALRNAINQANQRTELTIADQTRSIADWLIWKREVMPFQQAFLGQLQNRITNSRRRSEMSSSRYHQEEPQVVDVVVNIDESKLATEIENFEVIVGTLDQQLSQLNATTTVEIED